MASRSDKTIITSKLAARARWVARSGRSSSLQLAEGSSQFASFSHLSISVSRSIGATSVPGWPNHVRLPIIDRRYHTRGFSLITPENAESRILAGGEGGIEPRNPSVSIRSPGVRIKRPLMATKSAHAGVSRITPENTEGRDRRAG
jgi:hypothetical protein